MEYVVCLKNGEVYGTFYSPATAKAWAEVNRFKEESYEIKELINVSRQRFESECG